MITYQFSTREWQIERSDHFLKVFGCTPEDASEIHGRFLAGDGGYASLQFSVYRFYFSVQAVGDPPLPKSNDSVIWSGIARRLKSTKRICYQLLSDIVQEWTTENSTIQTEPIDDYLSILQRKAWTMWDSGAILTNKIMATECGVTINLVEKWKRQYIREAKNLKLMNDEDARFDPLEENEDPEEFEAPKTTEDYLAKHRFNERMFALEGRTKDEINTEKEWFAAKVKDWDAILSDSRAEALARALLLKELDVERVREALTMIPPVLAGKVNKAYSDLKEMLGDLETEYREQWEAVDKACPLAKAIAQKAKATGALSDFIKAYQQKVSDGSTALMDGIFTTLEIQVLCRQSEQDKVPQYRLGWVTHKNMAKQGIWDRKWELDKNAGQFDLPKTPAFQFFRMLDVETKRTIDRVRQVCGRELTDLEDDASKRGEYEPVEDFQRVIRENTDELSNTNPSVEKADDNANDDGGSTVQPDVGSGIAPGV